MTAPRIGAQVLGMIMCALVAGACGATGPSSTWVFAPTGGASATAVPSQPTPAPTSGPTPSAVATPDPALPPDATLAVEGGDAVTGQLGTFVWGDGGSDSPMLPGTPLAVGAQEPLTIALTMPTGVDTWSAVLTRVDAAGSGGAPIGIDDGPPPMTLRAPATGSWRLVVTIRFAEHAGSATYTWRLDVRG